MGPAQYRRPTLRHLENVLTFVRPKFSAAQRRYKTDFDRKVSFRLVVNVGDFLYVHREPCAWSKAKKRDPRRLDPDTTDASCEPLPKFEGPYGVFSATDTVFHTVRNGVNTSVSIDRVTKVPTGSHALQSSAATGGDVESGATTTKPLPVMALPYRTRGKPVRSERLRKIMSLKNSSGPAARKRVCNTVFGGMATTFRKTSTSQPSWYRGPSLIGTSERFRRSSPVPVNREGITTTYNRTEDRSRNELTGREKTAPLRRRVGRRHLHVALDTKEKERRRTKGDRQGARSANKNNGTRYLFTGSYRLLPHSLQ